MNRRITCPLIPMTILLLCAHSCAFDPLPNDCDGVCASQADCMNCIDSCETYIKNHADLPSILDNIAKRQPITDPNIDPDAVKNLEGCWCTACCNYKYPGDASHPCIFPCPCIPEEAPPTSYYGGGSGEPPPLNVSIREIIKVVNFNVCLILNIIWLVAASIAALMIILAGAKYLTADDPVDRKKARSRIIYAFTGLVLVFIACPLVDYLVENTDILPTKQTCKCYELMKIPPRPTTTTTTITRKVTTTTSTTTTTTTTTTQPQTSGCVVFDSSYARFMSKKDTPDDFIKFHDNARYVSNIASWLDGKNKKILVYLASGGKENEFSGGELEKVVGGAGYSIEYNGRPTEITESLLSPYGQVWFIDDYYHVDPELSQQEKDAIKAYHDKGGSIMVTGEEYEDGDCNIFMIRDITPLFGVTVSGNFDARSVLSPSFSVSPAFTSHQLSQGVTTISSSGSDVKYVSNNPEVKTIATVLGQPYILALESCKNGDGGPAASTTTTTKQATTTSTSSTTTTTVNCVPPYEPQKWNDDQRALMCNNCYNYGCDKRTDNFAQPGYASTGSGPTLSCSGVIQKAQSDGLQYLGATDKACTGCTHKVALVVAPAQDFHWYRQDRNGMWSHKPGQTPARDTDESGNKISNPETANRGIYTSFCGYFCVDKANINIAGSLPCAY